MDVGPLKFKLIYISMKNINLKKVFINCCIHCDRGRAYCTLRTLSMPCTAASSASLSA